MKQVKTVIFLFVLIFAFASLVQAQSDVSYQMKTESQTFDIEAQSLPAALKTYENITGIKLEYSDEIVEGRKTNGVRGTNSLAKALERILTGTGLSYKITAQGEVVLQKAVEKKVTERPAIKLQKTVVTATKTEHTLGDVPVVSAEVITKEEIEEANIETLADAVKLATNVYSIEGKGAAGVCKWSRAVASIQGLPSKFTQVLIDGQKLYGCAGRMYDISFYPVEMIERIEIIKGPASTLYGSEAIAGVINVITKSAPEKPTISASTGFGTYNTQVHKVGHGNKLDKFGYFLNYSRNQSDGMNPEVDEFKDDTFQATMEYKFSPTAKLSLKPLYHRREAVADPIKHEQYMLNSLLDWKPDEISHLKVRGSVLQLNYQPRRDKDGMTAYTYEAELDYSRLVRSLHLFTLGYQFQKDDYSDWGKWTGKHQTTHSLFCQDEMGFDPFTLVLGARVDHHNWWDNHVLPSASLLYRLTENFRLKAMVGTGFRSPKIVQISEGYMKKGKKFLKGNPALKPEKSIGYQLGVEYEITENLLTKVYLFRNDLEGLIEISKTAEVYKKLPVFGFKNVGEAYTQGVEMEVLTRFTDNLSGKLGYTFLESRNEKTDKELIYTPAHKLNIGFSFKQPEYGLGIDLRGEYIAKRYEDEANTKELGDYFLAHIKVKKDILKWLRAYISVDNIFDTKYEEATGVEMPGRTFFGGVNLRF